MGNWISTIFAANGRGCRADELENPGRRRCSLGRNSYWSAFPPRRLPGCRSWSLGDAAVAVVAAAVVAAAAASAGSFSAAGATYFPHIANSSPTDAFAVFSSPVANVEYSSPSRRRIGIRISVYVFVAAVPTGGLHDAAIYAAGDDIARSPTHLYVSIHSDASECRECPLPAIESPPLAIESPPLALPPLALPPLALSPLALSPFASPAHASNEIFSPLHLLQIVMPAIATPAIASPAVDDYYSIDCISVECASNTNCISVDGAYSTNRSVNATSINGASGNCMSVDSASVGGASVNGSIQ